ncbi:unnamed protein product [Acanthoscelides obtectus]|uniref:Uncharacterized protein n=1 Tax=Acanthoscelides obtectus TaxID=200917 RepID=A0A9P0LAJ2_ACAOB|nr:unnamed protein product [Acanthoscelides obtectus]CAK1656777.1 hypothetical protein AOBTE_LOCUS19907 [Acanthoscelides obtectus]
MFSVGIFHSFRLAKLTRLNRGNRAVLLQVLACNSLAD